MLSAIVASLIAIHICRGDGRDSGGRTKHPTPPTHGLQPPHIRWLSGQLLDGRAKAKHDFPRREANALDLGLVMLDVDGCIDIRPGMGA